MDLGQETLKWPQCQGEEGGEGLLLPSSSPCSWDLIVFVTPSLKSRHRAGRAATRRSLKSGSPCQHQHPAQAHSSSLLRSGHPRVSLAWAPHSYVTWVIGFWSLSGPFRLAVCLFGERKPVSPGRISQGGVSVLGLAPLPSFLGTPAPAVGSQTGHRRPPVDGASMWEEAISFSLVLLQR